MKKMVFLLFLSVIWFSFSVLPIPAAKADPMIGINVLLNRDISKDCLAELKKFGTIRDVLLEIRGVTLLAKSSVLPDIQKLPFVEAAGPDMERMGAPVDTVVAEDFMDGLSTWNLDTVNVTDFGFDNRRVPFSGNGVFVAVLDTGLLDSWRQYFPQERIAVEYAKSFGGGGNVNAAISEQPNKWEHDQNSHGTHVTSIILGFNFFGTPVNGTAPMATVIPVKVLNQSGSGWSSVIAYGIMYVAKLKEGPLAGSPVVINMSLGGSRLDAVEKAAIDYAVDKGVIIVAAAGNSGNEGMHYPGAYAPVISVGACGYKGQWSPLGNRGWWWNSNVAEPTSSQDFYIADFSSREKATQDLDVIAPGALIVGPYQVNSGQLSNYFLSGTSQATPHVAGIVALMTEKNPNLTAAQAEAILEASAIPFTAPGSMSVLLSNGSSATYTWDFDAVGEGLITVDTALNNTPE